MPASDRHIAHIDMDNFFVSVEQLRNPKLKGKPILIGGNNDRGIVAACSDEATKFGIHATMPMRIAQRLCKYAIIVKADYEEYSKQSKLITEIIKDAVPLVERSAIDEFYADLTGMDKFFGCMQFTKELNRKVYKHSGLSLSSGLASNKLVSKVAALQIKPQGQLEIPFGYEKLFLAPLSVLKLPGVGKETAFKLMKMGVETIKVLSDIPPEMLCNVVGKGGNELWRRANGIDESPVVPYKEQPSISKERLFQEDTIDLHILEAELIQLTEQLGFELRQKNKLARCIVLRIRYTDEETHTLQKMIQPASTDQLLIAAVKALFRQLFTRRVLVRFISIRFTNLLTGTHQFNLFEDRAETIRLYQSIDSIKQRFGKKIVGSAGGL